MTEARALPGLLAEIAEVAGEDVALTLARAKGGRQIYIPAIPADDHWMCQLIGISTARAVCEQLTAGISGRREVVPQGPTGKQAQLRAADRALMDQMIREQYSESDIAAATGYTVRTVRKRRAKLGKPCDTRQLAFL